MFKQFSRLCDALPSSDYEIWEDTPNDPPDVAVGANLLGIEFVKFFHGSGSAGSSAKKVENFYDQVVARARERFEENHSTPLWVTFTWQRYSLDLNKSLRDELAGAIVETMDELLPGLGEEPLLLRGYELSNSDLQRYLSSVEIMVVEKKNSYWGNIQAARFSDSITRMDVEEKTREKEADLPRYKDRFGEVWLVIVAEGSGMASILGLDEPFKPGCLTSEFDRVYLLDAGKNQLMLLTDSKG